MPYELLDYAGQPEYWLSHQFFLSASNSIYVVVVSLKDANGANFKERFLYWATFLASQRRSHAKPTKVVVVGTHRDEAEPATIDDFDRSLFQFNSLLLKLGLQVSFGQVL